MSEIKNKDFLEFEEAIKNKDLISITRILTLGNNIINERTTQGALFINLAIETDCKIAMLLIENGADINKLDKLGFTPIYNMIRSIQTHLKFDVPSDAISRMFQLIIQKGALLSVQDRRGNTPINYIAQRAKSSRTTNDIYTKIGKVLLALDKNASETIQIKNNMGKSPLDYLSRNGNFILRDAVFSRLPHVQNAINRTIAETEAATKKILNSVSEDAL